MAAFLGAVLILSTVVDASNCSIPPIFVDIHNRAVDGGITFQYGLFTGIGSPTSQNLSQWPSFSNNETTVGNLDYCSSSPFKDCITQSHGFYSPELSETSSYKSLDNLGSIPATIVETALDTFNLFTHYFDPSPPNVTRLAAFPMTVLSNASSSSTTWFGPAGLVGLGPASTLLRHLSDQRLIATRSFGLYLGTAYEPANGAINGSLTLGGYDSGRLQGDVYNFSIVNPVGPAAMNSPFKVSVTQMTLSTADGKGTDLLNASLDAYITTSQYQLDLPAAVTQKFADETGATTSAAADDDDEAGGNPVLRLPNNFDATLTISLAGGLNITYDAQWLRNVSNKSPISAGSIASSSKNTTASTNTNTEVGLFGSAFLSSIYFIANYDAQPPTFHLAAARPQGPYVLTQTLCADTVPVAAKSTKISSFSKAGMTGAIVAGVVGGIGFSFACYWLFRKWMQSRLRRKQRRAAMEIKGFSTNTNTKAKAKSLSDRDSESSEMATFGFDFNSHAHQQYQNYLQSQSQGKAQTQSQNRGQNQHQNQNQQTQPQTQQQAQVQPEPQPQPQTQQYSSDDTDYNPQDRAQEYLRLRDDAYTNAGPLTPATGVPLLSSQQGPGQSETRTFFGPSRSSPGPGSRSQTPTQTSQHLQPDMGAGFPPRRKSQESARRMVLGLNLQTEFDPPPGKGGAGPARIKARGGKKESLLKKVFPPPGRA
ncbi:hypothetical protein A1O3_00234 [Capronia epimyces CBS 606.96]|uniref:Peptidase A1 domain-containing protein n=1 Tax=Capronia epimyces CBS 606.96 TaxID=1182542 RepID=W9ZAX5_9EURO|nr:uncharacterized protein A1O3_00234 [Capronia epimyces CBS 606.96]EXJ91684.1 hypothetical protein A1O3_00234 [Capronia epimyces CBS 606.96]